MKKVVSIIGLLILVIALLVWLLFSREKGQLKIVSQKENIAQTSKLNTGSSVNEFEERALKPVFKDCSASDNRQWLEHKLMSKNDKAELVFNNLHFKNAHGEVFRYRTFTDQVKREVFYKEDADAFPRKLDLSSKEKAQYLASFRKMETIYKEQGLSLGAWYWEVRNGRITYVQWSQNGESLDCYLK